MPKATGYLRIEREGAPAQRVPLNSPVLTIGRQPDNAIVLVDQLVSRQHAEIRLEPQGPTVTDLGSRNGTFLGRVRLLPHQARLLTSSMAVRIGPYTLAYEPQQSAPARKAGDNEPVDGPQPTVVSTDAVPAIPPAPSVPPRPTHPMPGALGPSSRYLEYLPTIYQSDLFLGRYLLIHESLWEPLEQRQDHIAMYVDPRTCPASFLPWIASWLELPLDASWPEDRQRRIVGQAMELYRWRGTRHGIIRAIELFTGLTPSIAEDPSTPFVFRVTLTVPPGSQVERAHIEHLIRMHKPAHAGFVLDLHA